MFEKRQVRIAAGILYGGTYGILLGGLYYNRYWAPRPGFSETEQLQTMIDHLEVGLISGIAFGIVFGLRPHRISAWVGSLGFGVVGVLLCRPAMSLLIGPNHSSLELAALALVEAMPYVGMLVGPAVEKWIQAKPESD